MPFYETVFIVRPDVATTQVDQVTEKISELAKKNSATIIKTEQWGLRTLAYRINKYKKGYYVMLGLDMPGDAVAELERNLRLSEDIIRFHTIKVEEMDDNPSIMMKYKSKYDDADSGAYEGK